MPSAVASGGGYNNLSIEARVAPVEPVRTLSGLLQWNPWIEGRGPANRGASARTDECEVTMSDTLLIIEDERLLGIELTRHFSKEGWDVDLAGSIVEARCLREMIKRLAVVPFSGLVISGETGTGKGLVARILHHSGPRPDGPMIEVNCAARPRDLLESELFGHEAVAFTGAKGRHRGYLEQADGGTLFLDEIGEMDLDLQAKLLTAIKDRELRRVGGEKSIKVDVKVLVASNHDLEDEVRAGSSRADLYHRLSVFFLRLPALRERLDDLDELVPNMVAGIQTALKRNDYNVTATARALGTTREMLRYRIQKYHLSLRAHNGARTEGERIEAV